MSRKTEPAWISMSSPVGPIRFQSAMNGTIASATACADMVGRARMIAISLPDRSERTFIQSPSPWGVPGQSHGPSWTVRVARGSANLLTGSSRRRWW